MGFVYLFFYFVVVDNAITLFNSFFHDFRGFNDFRIFDLAQEELLKNNLQGIIERFVASKRHFHL